MSREYTNKIILDKTKDRIIGVICSSCDSETNHKVCNSVELSWTYEPADFSGRGTYEIIRCMGCDGVCFRATSTNSEDYHRDSDGHEIYDETEKIYPNRLQGRQSLRGLYSLPIKIRSLYTETHTALSSRLSILSGAGIRALIEAVCKEERASGKNLEKRVDNLVEKTVLTRRNADILHKTRFLGNRSVHEIEAASDEELSVAFDIIENLLETIYIIPKKAENLKKQ